MHAHNEACTHYTRDMCHYWFFRWYSLLVLLLLRHQGDSGGPHVGPLQACLIAYASLQLMPAVATYCNFNDTTVTKLLGIVPQKVNLAPPLAEVPLHHVIRTCSKWLRLAPAKVHAPLCPSPCIIYFLTGNMGTPSSKLFL